MIEIEGYKAFRGSMIIRPYGCEPFALVGSWLYKPDTNCWYGEGHSFPAEICEILTEE